MDNLADLPVNVVDVGVLLFFLVIGVFGYFQGFVQMVLFVLSWIGAAAVTFFAFPHVRPIARDLITVHALAADFATGIVVFIAALVVFFLVTRALSSAVRESALNALDRSLGFLFGVVLSSVVVCAAYVGLQMVLPDPNERPAWIKDARTMPLIEAGATALIGLVPEEHRPDLPGGSVSPSSDGSAEQLLQPAPKAERPPENDGYEPAERSGIERVIEAVQ